VQLYDALEQVWPSPAVEVARWVARTRAEDTPERRREAEDRLRELTDAGPAYVRRDAAFALADLLWRERRLEEARELYETLAELATAESVRRFCRRRAGTMR
jgi:RNA polymerase sigma-70 factor (ECF subfamily)